MTTGRAIVMPVMPVKLISSHLAMVAASGVLLLLAFPRPGWGVLAHVALVPATILAIRSCGYRRLAWTGWLVGWAWWLVIIRWMAAIDIGGYMAVAAFLALYWGAGLVLLRWFHRCYRSPMVVTLPAVWVSLEIIRGLGPAGGWGWYCLGHTQAPFVAGQAPSALIQCADLFGEPTVSFLVAMTNGLIVDLVTRPMFKPVEAGGDKPALRRVSKGLLAGVVLWLGAMVGAYVYGRACIAAAGGAARQGLQVVVVQTNQPQNNKNHPTREGDIRDFNELLGLTRQAVAAAPKADLIVWPETVFPVPVNPAARAFFDSYGDPNDLNRFHREASELVAAARVNLLTGSHSASEFDDHGFPAVKSNSVFLYQPDGTQYGEFYSKIHRVPFGEYIPWVEDWPWLKAQFIRYFSPYKYDYTLNPGKDLVVFPVSRIAGAATRPGTEGVVRVVTPICFEDTISRLTRPMVYAPNGTKRADMIVNVTNDGWYSDSDEPLQHLQLAVFRSVELRVPTARAVNTGVSGFIDSVGRIGPVVTAEGRVQGVAGVVGSAVKLDERSTLFGRVGGTPMGLMMALTGILAAAGPLWRLRRVEKGS